MERLTRTDNVIFDPETITIYDFMMSNGKTEVNGLSLSEMEKREGKPLSIGNFAPVHEMKQKQFVKPAQKITEKEWVYALEVLPPLKWRSAEGSQSFMISELIYGEIANIYCQIGETFFIMADRVSLTHDEIVRKCESVR